MTERPVVFTDLRVRPFDPASVKSVAATLAPTCDAVLVGEHQGRPDFPPAILADLARRAGAEPWVTLTCRAATPWCWNRSCGRSRRSTWRGCTA